jgi:hypothetical protein
MYHPQMRNHRVCLVCHVKWIDKALSVGSSASTGPLVGHLRTHAAEYLEYMKKKNAVDEEVHVAKKAEG